MFVVDNASSDGSADMVATEYPQVRLIINPHNTGFAAANNLAIRQCSGSYVLLLNPDTELLPGAIISLLDIMLRHPNVGVSGARLLNRNGSLQQSCYLFPTLSREAWLLFHLDRVLPYAVYETHKWSLSLNRRVDSVQGACMLVRSACLEQVGLLDEDYFMYTEEVDLNYRIAKAGWDIYWVPRARVIHLGGQSTKQIATEMFIRLYQSKVLFFRKHYGSRAAIVYKGILAAASSVRLLASTLRLRTNHSVQDEASLRANYRQLLFELNEL